jgi:FkbM family methyltransferase
VNAALTPKSHRMFEGLKIRTSRFIARRRHRPLLRALHHLASFFEDAYENVEWDMAVNGEQEVIRRLAPARFTTVFDIGAHIGDWSLAALQAWPDARVHAFEVAPPTFARLAQRIASSGFSTRTTLNDVGLSDSEGPREMYYFPDHPNLTCDQPRHPQLRATIFRGRCVTGDDYVKAHGIAAVNFAKLDVEGAEHLVLKGVRDTIAAERLDCIQFEYGAFSIQTHVLLADYYEMLGSRYWIGKIYPTHVAFTDYDWTHESFRFCNFLCVSRRRADLRALVSA